MMLLVGGLVVFLITLIPGLVIRERQRATLVSMGLLAVMFLFVLYMAVRLEV